MVVRKRLYALIYLCLVTSWSWGIEYQPWIGNYLEFELRNALLYQSYSAVAIQSNPVNYFSRDAFFKTSLSNALKPEFSIEAEFVPAQTRKQRPGVDHISLAGRYVWADDLIGAHMTVTTGAVFTQAFSKSLKDVSSFHHGISEMEFFLSLGKETAVCREEWVQRWWGFIGGGTAILRGAPWLRGKFAYDYRFNQFQELSLFAHCLFGLGSKRLNPYHFHGYGSIQHQSLDLGLRYTYLIAYFGDFNIEYSYRIYARNFPARTHQILFTLLSTFGLGEL